MVIGMFLGQHYTMELYFLLLACSALYDKMSRSQAVNDFVKLKGTIPAQKISYPHRKKKINEE